MNSRINETIKSSLSGLGEIIDVNTVIGKEVNINDGIIIPIVDVSTCILSGGGEYGKVGIFKSGNDLPFSAGNGTYISLKPCGVIVKEKGGNIDVLSVNNKPLDNIIDKVFDYLNRENK